MMGGGERVRWRGAFLAAGVGVLGGTAGAAAQTPMSYLRSFGPKGEVTVTLMWGLLALSIGVVVIISILVLFGALRRRSFPAFRPGEVLPVTRSPGGLGWIYFGIALTTTILIGLTVWTVAVMAAIEEPAEEPRFTIEITGQQWWWEARYLDRENPFREFETANELHIPVGEPVRIKLRTKDVIHSFWVPALGGKTDLIPGQVNTTWLQADHAGVYRGQCGEYCGAQHAKMALKVFADEPSQFAAWWNGQLKPAETPPEGQTVVRSGAERFRLRCGACHAVRGTLAGGDLGPDLTHLMSRTSIAAVTLPNTVGDLSGWIADPQHIKPKSKMPKLELSGPELAAIRSYLLTLE
ncbi:cytochrome c oxidase subunit II [Aurantimonas marina]|uniref:cytochrome c oxidase subunit II n=1 Tax=Aurantimonas marina TaxID=2780508 RepID=UPI001E2E9BF1|nr:cytochrome c oxidase subunit II [Aurantimonas marina]